jgi:hypothetical protein
LGRLSCLVGLKRHSLGEIGLLVRSLRGTPSFSFTHFDSGNLEIPSDSGRNHTTLR